MTESMLQMDVNADDVSAISNMDKFLTIKQASDYLRLHPSTIRSYIRRGTLAAFRIQGSQNVLIPEDAIRALIVPIVPKEKN